MKTDSPGAFWPRRGLSDSYSRCTAHARPLTRGTASTADFSMNRPLYGRPTRNSFIALRREAEREKERSCGMPANYCDTTEIEDRVCVTSPGRVTMAIYVMSLRERAHFSRNYRHAVMRPTPPGLNYFHRRKRPFATVIGNLC